MAILNPYLTFDGTAREAMTFYQSVLGGELAVSTFGEFGDADAPYANQIMHAQLETPSGFTLMASDLPPGMPGPATGGFAVSLSGAEDDELRGYWDGLSDGATVTVPLEKQMWGAEFGQLVDRYGVSWMVNIGPAGE